MTDEIPERRAGLKTALVFAMLFAVLGAVVVFAYYATFSRPVTTVILIRHAEKIIDPNDPDVDLSPAGQARARELVDIFGDSNINAIYATQYKRTQETVKPLADKLGIPVSVVNSKSTGDLLAQIRSQHSGQTVFIAGHNNTVPEIIAALGGPKYPTIPENEYDNIYIVTVYRTGKAKVVKMKYPVASAYYKIEPGMAWDGFVKRGKVKVRAGGHSWSENGVSFSHTEEVYQSPDAARFVFSQLKGELHTGAELGLSGLLAFKVENRNRGTRISWVCGTGLHYLDTETYKFALTSLGTSDVHDC